MPTLFIYTTPHPAHKALADSIGCEYIQSSQAIPFFGRILNALAINNKIYKKKYDIILTESISRDLLAGAYYKTDHPSTKLVALLTDPKLYELKEAPLFDKILTYWALDKADLLLVGSEMMLNLVPYEFRAKTRLFYPGIADIGDYLKKKAKFGRNFVFVGRLDDYKGTDLLPRLFNRFRYRVHDAKLYIAGDGPNLNLFKNRIQDGIIYVGKTKNSLFMADIASIYVSTARFEPSGVAVLEAMAQGLVPIVTNGVGYSSIVREIDQSLVVSSENEAADLAYSLTHDKKLWNTYSSAAKKIASKYSYKFMINEFKKVLKSISVIK